MATSPVLALRAGPTNLAGSPRLKVQVATTASSSSSTSTVPS